MAASWIFTALRLDTQDPAHIRELLLGKESVVNSGNYRHSARRFIHGYVNQLEGALRGVRTANLWAVVTSAVSPAANPAGSITCVQANAAGDSVTFTFGTYVITLTEGASGHFLRGANNDACAVALRAAINAHPVLGGIFTAAGATNVVTVTGKIPGAFLHDVAIGTSDATAFTPIVQLTGGVEGTAQMFPQHLLLNRTAP
jgi:hypothetical protein